MSEFLEIIIEDEHRPVFRTYSVRVPGQIVARNLSSSDAYIVYESLSKPGFLRHSIQSYVDNEAELADVEAAVRHVIREARDHLPPVPPRLHDQKVHIYLYPERKELP